MQQTIWNIAGYVAVVLSLSGNVGVVLKRRWGLGLWIASNTVWIPYYWLRADYPSVILFATYMGLAVWGFVRWGKG